MRRVQGELFLKMTLIGTGLLALGLGTSLVLTDPSPWTLPRRTWRWFAIRPKETPTIRPNFRPQPPKDEVPPFSDITFDDSGYATAIRFSKPIADPSSLAQIRDSVVGRGQRGIEYLESKLASLPPSDPATPSTTANIQQIIASVLMYEGRWVEASERIARARPPIRAVRTCSGPTWTPIAESPRPQTRRDRELRRLLQRVELHLPPRRLRRPSTDRRLSGGDRALHALPRATARRHGRPLAPECGLHDPRRIPEGGPGRVPPSAGPVRRDGR